MWMWFRCFDIDSEFSKGIENFGENVFEETNETIRIDKIRYIQLATYISGSIIFNEFL